MEIKITRANELNIAEVLSAGIVIASAQDALDLMGELYFEDCERILLYEKDISPAFFDLKTGLAGEILQKFVNYRIKLAIVGDYQRHKSQSMQNFIYESNKAGNIIFASTWEDAISKLVRFK